MEVEDENKKKITVQNPAYATSIAWDQKVLRFLLNSLSPEILSHVLEMDSTAEAWAAITAIYYNTLYVASINGNPNTTIDDLFGRFCSYDMRNDTLEETAMTAEIRVVVMVTSIVNDALMTAEIAATTLETAAMMVETIPTVVMMEVKDALAKFVVAHQSLLLMSPVKFTRFMVIPRLTASGASKMTMMMMVTVA
ncbi:hypothetical protein QYE76_015195 [Lolium multiflorum]|uniref:Uncharacterized protein n=1 Tax=Lolium multiflorum TaxID=4521 RepID=A0AAD8U606_LOLMU|nr:hypothetical protein QYE76_015195 [Lolium multiflorum]